MFFFILFALSFSVYLVLAQTASHKDIILVDGDSVQLSYEGYTILNIDEDSQITYAKLSEINFYGNGLETPTINVAGGAINGTFRVYKHNFFKNY